jgi:hypothetical protein
MVSFFIFRLRLYLAGGRPGAGAEARVFLGQQ